MPLHRTATLIATATPGTAADGSDHRAQPPEVTVSRVLGDSFSASPVGHHHETLTHLDTADQRLAAAGLDVVFVARSGRLVAHHADGAQTEQQVGSVGWPALVADLPAGPVRELITGPAWVRALLPYATTVADTRTFAIMNRDAKTVVRLEWIERRLVRPRRADLPARVRVAALRGYAADAAAVTRLLVADGALAPAAGAWRAELRALPGVLPAPPPRPVMEPDQAAAVAVAHALRWYLEGMEAAVDGILADTDSEFLHEFRVLVRRTRSVLKLLGDVLPTGPTQRAVGEFRWLGAVTTPTRDLDVYLLNLDAMAASLSRPVDLEAFGRHVRGRRAAAHRALVRSLRSKRFAGLRTQWRADLDEVLASPAPPGPTAAEVADQRIHRTFGKVTKRARSITAESPSEQIHALRKAVKELRYLLEVFRPLCDPKAYRRVIADFKDLQDLLGEFQDGEVQALALREFAREMVTDGTGEVHTLLAMGELAGRFEAQQQAARATLTERHEAFLGRGAARHVDELVRA